VPLGDSLTALIFNSFWAVAPKYKPAAPASESPRAKKTHLLAGLMIKSAFDFNVSRLGVSPGFAMTNRGCRPNGSLKQIESHLINQLAGK